MKKSKNGIGYLTMHNTNRINKRFIHINSNFEFLKGEVIVLADYRSITIKRPDFDYQGKSRKLHSPRLMWFCTSFTIGADTQDLPLGKFLFDEEDSNEDQLVAYFETI